MKTATLVKNINITREFLTGGSAIFTVSNPAGQHYTYRVTAPDEQKDPKKPLYFVAYLSGPDNTADYTYMCAMRPTGELFLTKASKITADENLFKVAKWAIGIVFAGKEIPDGYKIQHVGKCGKCGRPLTTDESLAIGLGPICAGKE